MLFMHCEWQQPISAVVESSSLKTYWSHEPHVRLTTRSAIARVDSVDRTHSSPMLSCSEFGPSCIAATSTRRGSPFRRPADCSGRSRSAAAGLAPSRKLA